MKEAFLKIKESNKIEVDFDAIVKKVNIDDQNDFIELDIEENNPLFEALTLIKGETYPLPKVHDIINIKEISFDFDNFFNFKVFAKGKIKQTSEDMTTSKIYNEIYSFAKNEILESLKKLIGIKEKIFTGLFKVNMVFDKEKYYTLLCLEDLKIR